MSVKTPKYTPTFPEMQSFLIGRKNISAKERLRRDIDELKKKQLWEFQYLFSSFIPADLLRSRFGNINLRNRVFSMEIVFWAFLNQILLYGTSCSETVKKVQSWMLIRKRQLPSSSTSAYCQARKRLPLELLRKINQHIISVIAGTEPSEKLWKNRVVKVVDGTGLTMPDTPGNQQIYPQPKSMKPGCGFPQINLAAIFSLSNGSMLGYAFGGRNQSENLLWLKLWRLLCPGDIILADKGFSSFSNIAGLLQKNVDSVMRLHGCRAKNFKFSQGKRLGHKDVLVTWPRPYTTGANWTDEQWDNLPKSLTIRVIEAPVLHKGFRTQKVLICTTLLDEKKYPAEDIARLYFKRWQVELFYRDIKTTMHMDILRSRSPQMIEKELAMYAICYNLARGMMQDAARMYEVPVHRISFKATIQQFNQWLWLFMRTDITLEKIREIKRKFYAKLVDRLIQDRPGRNEPRARKRRPKPFNLLTRPRQEMVIDYHHNRPGKKNAFFALT